MVYLVEQSTDPRCCPVFNWIGDPYYFRDMPHETPPGTRLVVEGFPRVLEIESSHTTLPDFFLLSGKYAVSSKTKDILEELEPGVHQFIPIVLKKKSGEPFEGKFYVLHPRSAVDAIAPELSDVSIHTTPGGRVTMRLSKVNPKLTSYKSKINGRHFWTGDESFSNLFFSSDEFFQKIQNEKLIGFKFIPMSVV
ncbi:imm11 family protein [Roseibium album]|uniref:imm11 family protein n=1 Tax=Roseibium album TaxID=311410 RepID=UPI00249310EF|nr:DUF1629 domain-containing protein [Roseibium album]